MNDFILKGRLDGRQRNKLKSLFDMMYSPRDLADEIGVHIDQIYGVYIPLGCPHERDTRNHILINGKAFLNWYRTIYTKLRIGENETYCRTCQKAVQIFQPVEHEKNGFFYIVSTCPVCGRRGLPKIIANTRRGHGK